jgi:hypothetical protein
MSYKLLFALAVAVVALTGCSQNPIAGKAVAPERSDSEFLEARNARADELYVNPNSAEGGRAFRKIYVAAANLSKVQIIQPEGADPDSEWALDENEANIIQKALRDELGTTLSFESAYNIVEKREDSDMVINTTLVAIHPNSTRQEIAAGAQAGGALTVSMALVNTRTGNVMIRAVDTKSTDNIWAFNQVGNADPAINLIFRSWGNSMRRGLLNLQGRIYDPLAQPLQLKER